MELKGSPELARQFLALLGGPDESADFRMKVDDLSARLTDAVDVDPSKASDLATTILDVLDGPPDQWTFEVARQLVERRTGHDIQALEPSWTEILERAHQ